MYYSIYILQFIASTTRYSIAGIQQGRIVQAKRANQPGGEKARRWNSEWVIKARHPMCDAVAVAVLPF